MDKACYVDKVQNAFSTIPQTTVVLCVQGKHLLSCAEEPGDVIEFIDA